MDFQTQGAAWLEGLRTRRRNPVKAGTISCYSSYLRNWIWPTIGSVDLANFGNGAMKEFVQHLGTFNIGPKTTTEIVQAVKQVMSSATDQEGDLLYPRVWKPNFIDLPLVEKKKQKTPTIGAEDLARDIRLSGPVVGPFLAMLGGTGLRIAEALALRIGDDRCNTGWIPEKRLILVRTQIQRTLEVSPKTEAGYREVDLSPKLNQTLIDLAGKRRGGFLFENTKGGHLHQTTLWKNVLSPLGIPGFHSLRRFRITRLREYGCPEDIIRYWVGHAGQDITDRYSKLAENIELRRTWADRVGLGFDIDIRQKSEVVCPTKDLKIAPITASVVA